MTHIDEIDFEMAVAEWFRATYGDDAVEQQVYQDGPYWFADIVVDLDFATLYVEVENDADSVREGVGQAIGYAAVLPNEGIPMVVTPEHHLDDDEVARLSKGSSVVIREYSVDDGGFV